MVLQWFNEIMAWWSALPAAGQFFFLMPFVVAVFALLTQTLGKDSV
jgi:hypothetical protein